MRQERQCEQLTTVAMKLVISVTPTDSPVPADVARQLGTSERHILSRQYAVSLGGTPARPPPRSWQLYDADSWLLLAHTHLLDDQTYHGAVVWRVHHVASSLYPVTVFVTSSLFHQKVNSSHVTSSPCDEFTVSRWHDVSGM